MRTTLTIEQDVLDKAREIAGRLKCPVLLNCERGARSQLLS